mmetsp:Transcript_45631/g.74394  ORF Transcript_45631/g.74394 Transcript_45631/m.74394 type:complete len:588 (+) Transcript_45631:92-1855(+)
MSLGEYQEETVPETVVLDCVRTDSGRSAIIGCVAINRPHLSSTVASVLTALNYRIVSLRSTLKQKSDRSQNPTAAAAVVIDATTSSEANEKHDIVHTLNSTDNNSDIVKKTSNSPSSFLSSPEEDDSRGSLLNGNGNVTEFSLKVLPSCGRFTDAELLSLKGAINDALENEYDGIPLDTPGSCTVLQVSGIESPSIHWAISHCITSSGPSFRILRSHFLVSGNRFIDTFFISDNSKQLSSDSVVTIESSIRHALQLCGTVRTISIFNIEGAQSHVAISSDNSNAADDQLPSFGPRPKFLKGSESRRHQVLKEGREDVAGRENVTGHAVLNDEWFREPVPKARLSPGATTPSWLSDVAALNNIEVTWDDREDDDCTRVHVSCHYSPSIFMDALLLFADLNLLVTSAVCTPIRSTPASPSSELSSCETLSVTSLSSEPIVSGVSKLATTTSSSSSSSYDTTPHIPSLSESLSLSMTFTLTDQNYRPIRSTSWQEWIRDLLVCAIYRPAIQPSRHTAVEYVAETQAPGCLEAITGALMSRHVVIDWGRVAWLGLRLLGAFHITDRYGMPIDNEVDLHMINEAVVAGIANL